MDTEVIDGAIEGDLPEIDPAVIEAPAVEPEVGFDEGQAVGDVGENTVPENVLNLDEYADYMVDLGNGQYMPAAELKGGGLRQSDYTRKTQEVAAERQRLERAEALDRAMEANPQGTLQWLAQQHGLTIAEAKAAVERQQNDDYDYWADDEAPVTDPVEARIAAIEQRYELEQAKSQVESVFSHLEAKYGEDFDRSEVSRAAVSQGIHDPNMLEMVFRNMHYEKVVTGRQQAAQQAAEEQAQREQQRQAAAAKAAATTGASGGAIGENPAPAPRKNLTVREAAEMAWNQLYGADQ